MRCKPISAILLALLLLPVFISSVEADSAAPNVQWSKTFGYDAAYCVAQTSDGNLLIAAQSADNVHYLGHLAFDYNDVRGVLIKVSLRGNVLWNKSLPILPEAMIPTADGGFIIAGEAQTFFGNAETDTATWPIYQSFASLIKIDSDGTIVWNQKYLLPNQPIPTPTDNALMGTDNGAKVGFFLATNDDGYLIGGSYVMNDSAFAIWAIKPWLIKTDAAGNSVWIQVYGADTNFYVPNAMAGFISSAVQTGDGGFLLVGNINGLALTKTDSTGNIVWNKVSVVNSTGQNYTSYESVTNTTNGEYLLVGSKNYYIDNVGSSFPYLAKLDGDFNQVWSNTYDKQELYSFTLRYSSSNSRFFSAYNYFVKTDLEGNVQWIGEFNGTINALCPTTDGGYALAGQIDTNDFVHSGDIWLGKLSLTSTFTPTVNPSPSIPEFPDVILGVLVISIFVSIAVYTCVNKKTLAKLKD